MKVSTKHQYIIIHTSGEIIPGCNANKRKEAIEFFEQMMGASFRWNKQTDYKCIKLEIKNETNINHPSGYIC
jgi:hypothetical protein